MFYDYHMHSNFSNDSKADMEDMIKRSIDLGLKEICFTDHVDYDLDSDDSFGIDYNKYFDKIQSLQNKYKDNISIKKGIEIGLQKQIIDKCNNDINKYPFDFVICSQHAKFSLLLYFNINIIIKVYKNYSVLGHLDLVKRYGNYGKVLDDKPFDDIIEAILKQAIYDGKGIEVNTSCYRYNLPDLTPSRHILNMYKDLGGEIITTGSDSHNPTQIAYNFDYIYSYLQSIGFKYVCSFDKMNPQFIKI